MEWALACVGALTVGFFVFRALSRYAYSVRAVLLLEQILRVEFVPFLQRNGLTDVYMNAMRVAHAKGMPVEEFATAIVGMLDEAVGTKRGVA